MELARDEVRVLRDLDDLDQLLLSPDSRDAQPGLLQTRQIVVVHLVPVAVALLDDPLPVQARGAAALAEHDRIQSQPHRTALGGEPALLGQEIDDEVRRRPVELRGVRAAEPADVARVLDDRALHAQADAEERHAPLAGVAHRFDLALDPPIAEAAGYQNAVDTRELRL